MAGPLWASPVLGNALPSQLVMSQPGPDPDPDPIPNPNLNPNPNPNPNPTHFCETFGGVCEVRKLGSAKPPKLQSEEWNSKHRELNGNRNWGNGKGERN